MKRYEIYFFVEFFIIQTFQNVKKKLNVNQEYVHGDSYISEIACSLGPLYQPPINNELKVQIF